MTVHIFIPVFFNAQLGGLQAHVKEQVKAILNAQHECTVLCKPGPFSVSVRELGAHVVETDFTSLEEAISRSNDVATYDLVHAHPFGSRRIGLAVAKAQRIPFLLTLHGQYLDDLADYVDKVEGVLTVSPAIRDYVRQQISIPPERVIVYPNGVDRSVFYRESLKVSQLRSLFAADVYLGFRETDRIVSLVSRYDVDKTFILELIEETWKLLLNKRRFDIVWLVAGTGTLIKRLKDQAETINKAAGRQLVYFLGWQDERHLRLLYSNSHLAIAPGRSALESMACGTPVIAVGSKKYVGLLNRERISTGIRTNFGGFGSKHDEYKPGSLLSDLENVICDDSQLEALSDLSRRTVVEFDQQTLNRPLLNLYASLAGRAKWETVKGREFTGISTKRC